MSKTPKLSTREERIFLAIYESDLNQEAHYVYPLPPIVDLLNRKRQKRYFSLKELEAAARHFEELRLGGFYPELIESDSRVVPSRFQISPRGLSVASEMLEIAQSSAVERITTWRWWIPIAAIASTAAVILALFRIGD